MRSFIVVAAALAVLGVGPAGCGPKTRQPSTEPSTAGQRDPITGVMRAKLGHARGVLAGLARGDFAMIEVNAEALERVSLSTSWMVTDSVTYVVMSDEFRAIVRDMAAHARDEDLEAATADFAQMSATCVRCHTYLRRERLQRDFPDQISAVDPAPVIAAAAR